MILKTQKKKIVVRLHSLPPDDRLELKFPQCSDANRFIGFNGTVTKAISARMLESWQKYSCNKCGHEFKVEIDYGYVDLIEKPSKCPNSGCKSDKYTQIVSDSKLWKY